VFQGGSKPFKFFFWGLALVWMIVIFAFSSQANSGAYTETYLQDANVPVRKFAHMFEYAVLAVLYQTALAGSLAPSEIDLGDDKKHNLKHYFFALFLAILYALSDEWHQAFVPGRSASLFDSAVDAFGAAIGLASVYWLRKIFIRGAQRQPDQK
jgi:VanZ family protein